MLNYLINIIIDVFVFNHIKKWNEREKLAETE